MKDLHELFINELQLMYDGEKQIVKALPKVIKAVSSKKLKTALQDHLKETEEQVKRLDEAFKELGITPKKTHSEPMEVLLKQADKVIEADYSEIVKDAALINCAQHVEHFEICTYGTLKSYAKLFKYENIIDLLDKTAKEEGHANKKLTELAEGSLVMEGVNIKAKKEVA